MGGIEISHTIWTYNEQGDKVREREQDGPTVVFEYEYDAYGNWIRQTVHSETAIEEKQRIITYHK